jgi:hypothetical protein
MSDYLIRELDAIPHLQVDVSTEVVEAVGNGRLERVTLRDRSAAGVPVTCRQQPCS